MNKSNKPQMIQVSVVFRHTNGTYIAHVKDMLPYINLHTFYTQHNLFQELITVRFFDNLPTTELHAINYHVTKGKVYLSTTQKVEWELSVEI